VNALFSTIDEDKNEKVTKEEMLSFIKEVLTMIAGENDLDLKT